MIRSNHIHHQHPETTNTPHPSNHPSSPSFQQQDRRPASSLACPMAGACLPPQFREELVVILFSTQGGNQLTMLIIRVGSIMSTKQHPSSASAHTLKPGGCLRSRTRALVQGERQRDTTAHGSPTSDGSLMLEFRRFLPKRQMDDRPLP